MRAILLAGLTVALMASAETGVAVAAQEPKEPPKTAAPKDTITAEATRTKLLKAKVTVDFTNQPIGEIFKEFAHQAEERIDYTLMWTYGTGFPFQQKVTFATKDQPLDVALDELLKKAGGGLGYVVVSKEGDKYDGWVRLTTTGERGFSTPPASAEEEADASAKLVLAKKLIDAGRPASAKPVLEIIVRRFPTTKAGIEAKKLFNMMEKDKDK